MYVCVHTSSPWNCITSMLFLKYILKVSGFLISNHERHNCPDSPAPEMTKRKEPMLRDPCLPPQGLNNAYAAFEASSSHMGRLAISLSRSHQLCSWYPVQHRLQWDMMGSIHPDNTTDPFWTGCRAWHPSCSVKLGHCSLGNTSSLSPKQAHTDLSDINWTES